MNKHEKIALANIKKAFNWEVGGWINAMYDYEEDELKEYIPSTLEKAKEFIYQEAVNNTYGVCSVYCKPLKEMRFAGSEFIKKSINCLFESDEDIKEIAKVMNW